MPDTLHLDASPWHVHHLVLTIQMSHGGQPLSLYLQYLPRTPLPHAQAQTGDHNVPGTALGTWYKSPFTESLQQP